MRVSAVRVCLVSVLSGVVVACGGGVPGAAPGAAPPGAAPGGRPPMPVESVIVAARPVEQTSEYVAVLKSRTSVTIQPQVEGFLTRIAVASGARVARMQQGKDRSGNVGWVRVSPWGGPVGRFWNPESKLPCNAPPFGELVAVNVNTGEIAWKRPLGFYPELKARGLADTGAPNIGGPMVTQSGVLFVGASIDRYFRAFDSASGRLLWETELDAAAHSVPMTFLGKDGRQYVVVAAGGGSFLGSAAGRHIVAFALPRGKA